MLLDDLLKTDKLTEDHKTALEEYTSLIHLTMNTCGLTSLSNFPKLDTITIVRKIFIIFSLNLIAIN